MNDTLTRCECDDTHENNQTVCRYCWGQENVPMNKLTIGNIEKLQKDIDRLKTIKEWKVRVKEFATKFNLTDREAIDISKIKLP